MNINPIIRIEDYRQRREQRQRHADILERIQMIRYASMQLMKSTGELQEQINLLLGKPIPRRSLSDAVLLGIYVAALLVVVLGFAYVQLNGHGR